MLILLTLFLFVASLAILIIKKNKDSLILVGVCASLMIEVFGIMVFIAKKGGISPDILRFLFFSSRIQVALQYMLITLNTLGFIVAVGRCLFPMFVMLVALNYSTLPVVKRWRKIGAVSCIIPAMALLVYFPPVYRQITAGNPALHGVITNVGIGWILVYLLLALGLMIFEYFRASIKIYKAQLRQITITISALTGLYIIYFLQDPGQVYNFYDYSFVQSRGIGYMMLLPSYKNYLIIVTASIICSFFGFYSLIRYTQKTNLLGKDNTVIERNFDTAKVGASMFVHSMKNQLLSSKVLYGRIDQLYEEGADKVDTVKLRTYVSALEDFNTSMLSRMEDLYRSVKASAIYITPTSIAEIAHDAFERFHKKYPKVWVEVEGDDSLIVLADKVHLCEAVSNLLTNAQEALNEAGRGEKGKILMSYYNERQYTVISIADNGNGLTKSAQRKMFRPFYSSKNSNYNWGMGLYYVREIVKSHMGFLDVESKLGCGTTVIIVLPKYVPKVGKYKKEQIPQSDEAEHESE